MRSVYDHAVTERITDVQPTSFRHGGHLYSIQPIQPRKGIPTLAWVREDNGQVEIMTLRNVVGAVEDYEPARSMTADAIALHEADPSISVAALSAARERMDDSPLILNGGLREALLQRVATGQTLSKIACRCGRYKKNETDKTVGETSWLLRRCGLAPTKGVYSPWVHTDVLALIAREGLDLAPREVEVGVYDA